MKPLVLIPQHFGALVFDRRTSRYLPFDEDATALLDRSRTESAFALAGEDATRVPFVEAMEAVGLFDLNGRFDGVRLDAEPPRTHLLGPLAVHVELVSACNLSCTHCFAMPFDRPASDRLTLAELDALFAELASLGSFRLGLTGGEILLRHDVFDVIDAALDRGLHPCLTTNGLRITEAVARELGKRPLCWLNVSLEGATAASNDRVRGAGTFDAVMERLRILGKHARFTLAFTITADNHDEVDACVALARDVGAHTAVFRPLYPVGAAADRPELMPAFDDYLGALSRLADLADLHTLDPFGPDYRTQTEARLFTHAGCGAGNTVCSVSSVGDVNPCSFLGPGFDSGNVRQRSFRDIWNDGHRFRELRDPEQAGRDGFTGGCRARANAATQSAFGVDPWQAAHEAGRAPSPGCHVSGVVR